MDKEMVIFGPLLPLFPAEDGPEAVAAVNSLAMANSMASKAELTVCRLLHLTLAELRAARAKRER